MTHPKLIEVAKAITEVRGPAGDSIRSQVIKEAHEVGITDARQVMDALNAFGLQLARAAIQSLMEPTSDMQLAGAEADCAVENGSRPYIALWNAMLQTILNGKDEG